MSFITSYYIPICWRNSLLTSPCLLGKLPISLFIHRLGPFQTDIHTIVFIYIYIFVCIVPILIIVSIFETLDIPIYHTFNVSA